MGPIPYTRMTLWTEIPPDEVAARLRRIVRVKWFSLSPPPEPFRGSVDGMHFEIVRVLGSVLGLHYRNSFQAIISGDVSPSGGGTAIRMRMRPHVLVTAFMSVWFGGLLYGAAVMVRAGMRDGFGSGAGYGLLIASGMMVAGYLLVNLSFWSDVKRARGLLCEKLECSESVPANRLVRGQ